MKRYIIMLVVFLLTGCTLSQKQMPEVIEEKAITIQVADPSYANALKRVWNKTYPKLKDKVNFVVKDAYVQQFQADIEWTNDCDAIYKKAFAQPFECSGYTIPKQLQREVLEDYFLPVQATGYLFAYDDKRLQKLDMEPDDVVSFEAMIEKGKGEYYYQHYLMTLLPLWLGDEEIDDIEDYLDSEDAVHAIQRFLDLYHEMNFSDEIYIGHRNSMEAYAYGIINPQQMKSTAAYRNGTLHFTKTPAWQGHTLSPTAQVYGFMVNKNCNSQGLVQLFIDLVRSKEGLQAFLDTGEDCAVIAEDDVEDFTIYDSRRKEMIQAIGYSKLWNVETLEDKPGIRMKDILEKSDAYAILQNGVCAKKSAQQVHKEMVTAVEKWVNRH